jgi:hypothetical protein
MEAESVLPVGPALPELVELTLEKTSDKLGYDGNLQNEDACCWSESELCLKAFQRSPGLVLPERFMSN